MKAVGRFENECLDKIDANMKAQFSSVAASQWLELRLQVTNGLKILFFLSMNSQSLQPKINSMYRLKINYLNIYLACWCICVSRGVSYSGGSTRQQGHQPWHGELMKCNFVGILP